MVGIWRGNEETITDLNPTFQTNYNWKLNSKITPPLKRNLIPTPTLASDSNLNPDIGNVDFNIFFLRKNAFQIRFLNYSQTLELDYLKQLNY